MPFCWGGNLLQAVILSVESKVLISGPSLLRTGGTEAV